MATEIEFLSATPILASLDIERSTSFFVKHLGFAAIHVDPGVYGIVGRGNVQIHFWACPDKKYAEATACRVQVSGIDALYQSCKGDGIVHPNAPLEAKPWGSREFGVLDVDGNLVTFVER